MRASVSIQLTTPDMSVLGCRELEELLEASCAAAAPASEEDKSAPPAGPRRRQRDKKKDGVVAQKNALACMR
jgi:hypothetical protein